VQVDSATASIIVAIIALASTLGLAAFTGWRMRRKDRADAVDVEQGTISGRFKDADALMKYIDDKVEERVKARTAELERKLEGVRRQSDEMNRAVHQNVTQQWLWDHRGRPGELPMLPGPILDILGLGHFADPDFDNTENPYNPT
jgi:uncharacterized protein HemX